MSTLQERIDADGITSTATFHGRQNGQDEWTHDAWSVELSLDGRTLTVPFRMGTGYNGTEPDTATVLESLLSDAAGYYNADGFENWAAEYGYDTDSRKAEATYRDVEVQTHNLWGFLGDKLDAYLWETDQD